MFDWKLPQSHKLVSKLENIEKRTQPHVYVGFPYVETSRSVRWQASYVLISRPNSIWDPFVLSCPHICIDASFFRVPRGLNYSNTWGVATIRFPLVQCRCQVPTVFYIGVLVLFEGSPVG